MVEARIEAWGQKVLVGFLKISGIRYKSYLHEIWKFLAQMYFTNHLTSKCGITILERIDVKVGGNFY